jgi:NADPH:quinone reductase-like Zn-dependent oxidoreductase
MLAKNNVDDLRLLARLMATGKVAPLIERTYPLSEASEAVAYVGAKHAQAKIVIVP